MTREGGLTSAVENKDLFVGNDWTLPSREELLGTAFETFEKRLMESGWDKKVESFYALKLAFDEFLTDAMKNGNKFDVNKTVSVKLSIGKEKVIVTISDQGKRFDPKEVLARDLQSTEHIENGSGRGLQMVNEFKEFVTFTHNKKGNEVTIETK